MCLGQVAVIGDDPLDPGAFAGARDDDRIACLDRAAGDGAGVAAEVGIRPVDPLDGEAEGPAGAAVVDLDGLEVLEQRRAAIPGRAAAWLDDVVAIAGRDRHGDDGLEAEGLGELGEVVADVDETRLVEADQVDLVDGEDDVANAEQRDDEGVAPGLGEDALFGIDQKHGEIGGRGAGRHVARVLLVAGRVGDDEAAAVGGEEAIGDIDGDALLALGDEAIDEKGEVDLLAGRAEAARIRLESCELILEQALGVEQKAADQGRLAVVDAAAGEEAQEALVLMLGEEGGEAFRFHDVMGHQK